MTGDFEDDAGPDEEGSTATEGGSVMAERAPGENEARETNVALPRMQSESESMPSRVANL